jgi:hypothetical protein
MRVNVFGLLCATLVVLAVSGCAARAADPSTAPTSPVGDGYLCDGLSVSREAVEERVPVGDIDAGARIALSTAVWDDGSPLDLPPEEDWYVVVSTDDLVGVLRDVDVAANPETGWIAPDHEMQTVTWVEHATNLEPGWYGASSGTCALTVDLGDLTVPSVELEAADPQSRELRLLVTEQSCNSGEDAEGRVEVVSIDETDDQVRLILGVRPRGGINTCPSHPPTPFTVMLAEPLGDRDVVDASLADPRLLTATP